MVGYYFSKCKSEINISPHFCKEVRVSNYENERIIILLITDIITLLQFMIYTSNQVQHHTDPRKTRCTPFHFFPLMK